MTQEPIESRIIASPAKRFFVEMLTRDIELSDAVLDLLDNCVDGAIRTNASKPGILKADRPYEGYFAKITIDSTRFCIEDNCGGIPLDLARNYAFRFGRSDQNRDANIATVGVYGIGMKRALFKLGSDCTVTSNHIEGSFKVHIDEDWIGKDGEWHLHMDRDVNASASHGVKIEVKNLHQSIIYQFDPQKGSFENQIKSKIKDHYAYIIKKGFRVRVNDEIILPSTINTLIPLDYSKNDTSFIAPYIYKTVHDGVSIKLIMGMYERFPSEAELDDYIDGKRSKQIAGWTVVCNDRVVVSNDISHITGWGEAGVPVYHTQYVMLAGIVEFTSNDAGKLPITTTKRGVDLNSSLYSEVKDVMRDALKHFIGFTNKWKTQTEERAGMQTSTKSIDIRDAETSVPILKWQPVKKGLKGQRFVPTLPKPATERTHARISFTKSLYEINQVTQYLFDENINPKPNEVGETAFNWILKKAKA